MAMPCGRVYCFRRLLSLYPSCINTILHERIRINKCHGTRNFATSQYFLKKQSDSFKENKVSTDDDSAGLDKNLVNAAKSVASSLPGDKTSIESDLLRKLRAGAKLSHDQKSGEAPKSAARTGDLLKSMRVVMSNKDAEMEWKNLEKVPRVELSNFVAARKNRQLNQPSRRRDHDDAKLFGSQRLGIFPENFKPELKQPDLTLFDKVDKETAEVLYSRPNNYFEEQIQLTKVGKIWTFPVDNEAGWEEGKNVKFYDHVFLEKHIADFPQKGPIRHFMELVLVGLSKNPYMTVEQKKEHIQWFRDYFKQKQSVLEESMGIAVQFKDASSG